MSTVENPLFDFTAFTNPRSISLKPPYDARAIDLKFSEIRFNISYIDDRVGATASYTARPESNAAYLGKLIEQHIVKQGYHLVQDTPADEDRARFDKLASFTYQSEGADAAGSPVDSPVADWAYQAITDTFGTTPAPVRIRMMGGTVPTAKIVEVLQVPFVIIPLVNADNNQHAANENRKPPASTV